MDPRRTLPPAVALAALSAAVAGGLNRLLTGDRWLPLVVGAALVPHVLGFATRRRAAAWALAAWAVGLAAYLSWAVVPSTTRAGLPTRSTLDTIVDRLDAGLAVLGDQRAPVAPRPGVVLLVVVVVWIMAATADALAFRRGASIGAVGPAITLFIWIAALAPGAGRPVLPAAALVVTTSAFLALQHQFLETRRRVTVGPTAAVPAPGQVVGAVALAVTAAIAAAVVAPALPGAGAKPLVDLRDDRGASTYQTAIPPLVDVASNLKRPERIELFTVQAAAPQYWRTVALDRYTPRSGGQWTLRASGDGIARGMRQAAPPGALEQQFRIGLLGERWMPAAFAPVAVSRTDTLVVVDSLTLVTGRESVRGMSYTVASQPPPADLTDAQRRATAAPPPAELKRFTALPASAADVLRERARAITAGATNAYDRARLLRDYFRDGTFTYDPTVDLTDALDATVAFLRTRRGFCVQFASTYALMARAVGIPARVAVGFTPGALDPDTGRYRVTNYDAHAWPEVWLAGIGWTNRFDPTPPSAGPGGSDLPGDTAQTPAPASTEPTPGSTAATSPDPVPGEAAPGVPTPATPPARHRGTGSPLSALVLGAIVVVIVLVTALAIGPLRKWVRRASRRRRDEPAARVAGAWEEALDRLGELGEPPPLTQTPSEIAARSRALVGEAAITPLSRLADAHTAAQFGARPATDAEADAAWTELDVFSRALDDHLGVFGRIRARLAPLRTRPPARLGQGRDERVDR